MYLDTWIRRGLAVALILAIAFAAYAYAASL